MQLEQPTARQFREANIVFVTTRLIVVTQADHRYAKYGSCFEVSQLVVRRYATHVSCSERLQMVVRITNIAFGFLIKKCVRILNIRLSITE